MFIESTMDILILSGAFALVVVAVVTAMVGRQMYRVLRDISNITGRIDYVTERIETFIITPIEFIQEHLGDFKFIKTIISKFIGK